MTGQSATELVFGWSSAAVGIAVILLSLYGPVLCPTSSSAPVPAPFSRGCTSEVAVGSPNIVLIFALFGSALAGIALGATIHSIFKRQVGVWLLVVGTVVLAFGAVLAAASFGIIVLPALVLAGLTVWKATGNHGEANLRN